MADKQIHEPLDNLLLQIQLLTIQLQNVYWDALTWREYDSPVNKMYLKGDSSNSLLLLVRESCCHHHMYPND